MIDAYEIDTGGFEPPTPRLSAERSAAELRVEGDGPCPRRTITPGADRHVYPGKHPGRLHLSALHLSRITA